MLSKQIFVLLSAKNEVAPDSENALTKAKAFEFSSTKDEFHEQQYIYGDHQSNMLSLHKLVHVIYD